VKSVLLRKRPGKEYLAVSERGPWRVREPCGC